MTYRLLNKAALGALLLATASATLLSGAAVAQAGMSREQWQETQESAEVRQMNAALAQASQNPRFLQALTGNNLDVARNILVRNGAPDGFEVRMISITETSSESEGEDHPLAAPGFSTEDYIETRPFWITIRMWLHRVRTIAAPGAADSGDGELNFTLPVMIGCTEGHCEDVENGITRQMIGDAMADPRFMHALLAGNTDRATRALVRAGAPRDIVLPAITETESSGQDRPAGLSPFRYFEIPWWRWFFTIGVGRPVVDPPAADEVRRPNAN